MTYRRKDFSKFRPDVSCLEKRDLLSTFTVNSLADVAGPPGTVTLRQAVALSNLNPGTDTIDFAPTLTGTIHLTQGQLDISDDVAITHAAGPNTLAIDAGGTSRVFETHNVNVAVNGLTLQNGAALSTNVTPGAGGDGGAIQQDGGTLTLINDVFVGNKAFTRGGAVFNLYGTLNLVGDQFVSNAATLRGGAVYNSGVLNDVGSLYSGNSAGDGGGAIENASSILAIQGVTATVNGDVFVGNSTGAGEGGFSGGAAISNDNGAQLNVNGGMFLSNTAQTNGGAIQNSVGLGASKVVINGATFRANKATFGGAIYSDSSLSLANSTLQLNTAVLGGAVWAKNGTLTQTGNTIAFNTAPEVFLA